MFKRFFPTVSDGDPRRPDWLDAAFANFPFQIMETSGRDALASWEMLKKAGQGVPIVVGDSLYNILAGFTPRSEALTNLPPLEETLAAASAIRFPEDMFKQRARENGVLSPEEWAELEPEQGEWPDEAPESVDLTVAYDIQTGVPHSRVHIVLVPTDDPTTVPAHLRFGDYNACPRAEYHVAALRHWRDRYGAELVGLDMATLNVRVARKPATREEAFELARLQYAYCYDIVDQGVDTMSALAAMLLARDWWYFWWD